MDGPKIMFVCDYCSEHAPEMCGHFSANEVRLAPNGSWLCENCFDEETPSELGRFSDAPIAYLEAAPSPSPAPVALREAAERFEEIRLILVHHLNEPERTAFWKAVDGRKRCQAALASLSQPAKGAEGGK